jgi:hypothetical protein
LWLVSAPHSSISIGSRGRRLSSHCPRTNSRYAVLAPLIAPHRTACSAPPYRAWHGTATTGLGRPLCDTVHVGRNALCALAISA